MIRFEKRAATYLTGLSLSGTISSFSALKGVNEICGFYQDELTDKNKKDHISYVRLIKGFAWMAFSAFSGFGCYLLMKDFTHTENTLISAELDRKHQTQLENFTGYYQDRLKEKNSLRNLCWNYLESAESLEALEEGTSSNSIQSIATHAYKAYHTVEKEAQELKRQLGIFREEFNEDSQFLKAQLQNYEVARGVYLDFSQICKTPYSKLKTRHCQVQENLNHQLRKYSLLEGEIEEYRNEAFSMKNIVHCQEAYEINTGFSSIYNLGREETAKEKLSWWQWLMGLLG